MRALIALLAAGMLAACTADAEPTFPYFEEEGGRVRDGANILADATERELAAALDAAEANYGPQLAVVTVPSLHDYSIEDFSLFYARAWGLGDKDRNDGLLLLVAPNERKVRIEVGYGLEKTFDDPFCKDVLEQTVLPAFRAGNLEAGILSGTEALIERMRQHPTIPANDNAPVHVTEAA